VAVVVVETAMIRPVDVIATMAVAVADATVATASDEAAPIVPDASDRSRPLVRRHRVFVRPVATATLHSKRCPRRNSSLPRTFFVVVFPVFVKPSTE
jgi:hypothetical protein